MIGGSRQKEAGFLQEEEKQSGSKDRPLAKFCGISQAGLLNRFSASSFFASNDCGSAFNTARTEFLFDFLNMRKQICLLIGALALVVVITGCGNAESAKSLGKKSEAEDAAAQFFKLGMEYYSLKRGQLAGAPAGLPEDNSQAIECFRRAAEQGHAKSQVQLAQLLDAAEVFLNEIESIVDEEVEAAKWYQKAAEQGNGLAQMEIGDRYYYGIGVPQNDVEAYAWFLLAKARGYGDDVFGVSDKIEKLEERMTSNQRAQGQARSLELHKTIRERLDELQKQGTGNEEPY